MGGSFTIGTGVNDNETYASALQRDYWTTYRIRNLGVYAYSTSHVLLQLQEQFEAGHKIHLVAYGWIAHHLFRNYRRRKWLMGLADWGGENPLFEIENGLLKDDPADASLDPDDDGLTNLDEYQIGTFIGIPDSDGDGMPDGWENGFDLDPLKESGNDDADKDGRFDLQEYLMGSDPTAPDVDNTKNSGGNDSIDPIMITLVIILVIGIVSAIYLLLRRKAI